MLKKHWYTDKLKQFYQDLYIKIVQIQNLNKTLQNKH